jgi:hypothetical protein
VAITLTLAAAFEPYGPEWVILQKKFSTGATLREIGSMGEIMSELIGIPPPPREAKRNVGEMLRWFRRHWCVICPWLPHVQLRDYKEQIIDGLRQMVETMGGIL